MVLVGLLLLTAQATQYLEPGAKNFKKGSGGGVSAPQLSNLFPSPLSRSCGVQRPQLPINCYSPVAIQF